MFKQKTEPCTNCSAAKVPDLDAARVSRITNRKWRITNRHAIAMRLV
ncbi:MAG: hypothetical protein ACE5NM_00250 [Sedimentisphaerales bacterium]